MPSVLERLRTALAPGIVVERKLADGAMGEVYLGHDTALGRPVAIKVLRPERASAIAAERFAREARHAANLRHANVVQVHYAGEADGLLYYTMDYVSGETLAARLARGHLSPHKVVRLGLDLLAALAAAHAHKLIHRDIKPSNIFLDGDRALLGDFGVARAIDSSQTELTLPGTPVGTLAYISPEQLHDQPITFRTDIYAVGLVLYEAATGQRWAPLSDPAKGEWARVPAHLREPIRRALQLEPGDRWPEVGSFAKALASAERRSRRTSAAFAVAVAALVGLLVLKYPPGSEGGRGPAIARDLVVFPFATAALADSSMGPRLAGLTGWSIERLTGLKLAPRQVAIRAWRGSTLPEDRRLAELTGGRMRSRYGAWGVLRPRGTQLEVQLRIVSGAGEPIFAGDISGDSTDLPALGDLIALTITRSVFRDRRLRKADGLVRVSPEVLTEFMLGEEAFARNAWLTAERHYLRALQLDSTFVLAGWRLGNARRWMPLRNTPPYPPGLFQLFLSNREALSPVDRYLIEAQFRPSGAPRFERYEKAMLVAGDDPYAALLYGDELLHRGPLAGRSLRDAVAVLERAVATDSTMAPAWEHLAWALIRLGERKDAGAAVAQLERLTGRPEESEINLPMFLRMAHDLRFGSETVVAEVQAALGRSPAALALAARGAMSFDLPPAQAVLGAALAGSGATNELRASGLIAHGVALVALGRPSAALASFDSAATLFPEPSEARLQAAEWRVIPPALGAPGLDGLERERGRAALRTMADDSLVGPRAAWALALDAYVRRDSASAAAWGDRVRGSTGGGEGLSALLAGLEHAARGRFDAALAASEPALAYDSVGYAPDPFLRAATHLARGEWLARLGRAKEADQSWLWYENLDVRGWPGAEAQPAEVDWALSTYARSRRARLAGQHGRTADACLLARRVGEIWSEVEPAVAGFAGELATLERRCPQ